MIDHLGTWKLRFWDIVYIVSMNFISNGRLVSVISSSKKTSQFTTISPPPAEVDIIAINKELKILQICRSVFLNLQGSGTKTWRHPVTYCYDRTKYNSRFPTENLLKRPKVTLWSSEIKSSMSGIWTQYSRYTFVDQIFYKRSNERLNRQTFLPTRVLHQK